MIDLLSRIGKEFYVMLLAATPIIELRGAVPLAATMGLSMGEAFLFSLIGNIIPAPFIIWLARHLIKYFKSTALFHKFGTRLESKAIRKFEKIKRFTFVGLIILVAIPLPGTGVWTGALLASLMNLRIKTALPALIIGVVIADIIVTGITYGLFVF